MVPPTLSPPPQAQLTQAEPQLFVTDLEAALWFYSRLGFETVFRYGEPAFYAQVRRGAACANLRAEDARPFGQGDVERDELLAATFLVDDIEALQEEFIRAGEAPFRPVRRESWGARTFLMRDPAGNLLLFANA